MRIKSVKILFFISAPIFQGCGPDLLPEAKIKVTMTGDSMPSCRSEQCEITDTEQFMALAETISANENVVPIANLNSEELVFKIADNPKIIPKGFAIVSDKETCRSKERITSLKIPLIKSLLELGDGNWKICMAANVGNRRVLLSTKTLVVDKTPPVFTGPVSISANYTSRPVISWPVAVDALNGDHRLPIERKAEA